MNTWRNEIRDEDPASLIKFDIACKIYVEMAGHLPTATPQATCHLPNSFFFSMLKKLIFFFKLIFFLKI